MWNFVYLTEYDFKYKDPIGSTVKLQIYFYRIQTFNRIMFKLTCLRFKTLNIEYTAVKNEVFKLLFKYALVDGQSSHERPYEYR